MSKKMKKGSGLAGIISWASVSVVVSAIFITLTALAVPDTGMIHPILGTFLGGKTPILEDSYEKVYKSDYKTKEESVKAGDDLNVKIEQEGAVLLLNEGNALPIAKGSKVSVFGKNSVNLVLGGSGSGGGSGEGAATIFDGLKEGGIEYNSVLKEFYESSESGEGRSSSPKLADTSSSSPTLDIGETPASAYNSKIRNSFKEYNDAAIVVISRLGGESWDLPREQNVANGGIGGNHYLELDQNEYDMLDMATARFKKVVVVLNTLTSFQCDFIEEYNNTSDKRIDAVLWIGGPGKTGAKAFGSLLNGDVNPSGRTVDIYSKDFTKDPTWQNFGDGSQANNGVANTAFLENGTAVSGYNMVTYEEGVYLGYRYYETRDYEEVKLDASSTWYKDNVIFPFGYGLSYSTFDQKITSITGSLANGGQIEINVDAQHVSGPAGKEVVELYVSKPYTENGIEKPYVELVDYAKTELLADGAKQSFKFTVDAYDLANYDYNDANDNSFFGYELEAGEYTFFVSRNSHVRENAYDSKSVSLADSVTFLKDPITDYPVENRFTSDNYDDIQYRLSDVIVGNEKRKGMSRTDFEDTFPTPLTEEERTVMGDEKDEYTELSKLKSFAHNNTEIESVTEMPVIGAVNSSEIILHDLLKDDGTVDYNDPRWEDLLKRLTFNEMLNLVNNGAFQTIAIESIGKNLTNDSDGPIGFVNFMGGAVTAIFSGNTNFASEIVIGSTWNKSLGYEMGKIIGENGLWGDTSGNNSLPYSGWYAPAVNLHRSPFSGRNFEYYSEDPIISGKMAVNVITGARSKGVYADLKHFALNDQETNRAGVSTFCTEQALRELYLKPFELAVKGNDDVSLVKSAQDDGLVAFKGTLGIMSSFNRIGNKWTGGDYRLLTEVLRNEWGFQGLVICDYKTDNTFMDSRQMLYAGNDLILTSTTITMWNDAKADDAKDVEILRQATKNILFTVANSNSIQIKILGFKTEWWVTTIIVADCVIGAGLVAWGVLVFLKFFKKRKQANVVVE